MAARAEPQATRARGERTRYVAFAVESAASPDRAAFIAAVREASEARGPGFAERVKPWLTRFDGRVGILRCAHTGKEDAIRLLESLRAVNAGGRRVEVRVRTLGTSGTIAGCLRKWVPELRENP